MHDSQCCEDPQRLFKRPGGHYPAPGQLRALAELNQSPLGGIG